MASDLRIRVGNASATLVINATDQQVAEALRRYAQSLGIPLEGTANQQLGAVLEHWRDEVRRKSIQMLLAELDAASSAANRATAEAENQL